MASKKFRRAVNRETLITAGLYLLFFVWWYVTAYGFGDDPAQYRFIFGFPEWFFYSCIVGYIGISFILWYVVRKFFTNIPFDDDYDEDEVNKDV